MYGSSASSRCRVFTVAGLVVGCMMKSDHFIIQLPLATTSSIHILHAIEQLYSCQHTWVYCILVETAAEAKESSVSDMYIYILEVAVPFAIAATATYPGFRPQHYPCIWVKAGWGRQHEYEALRPQPRPVLYTLSTMATRCLNVLETIPEEGEENER